MKEITLIVNIEEDHLVPIHHLTGTIIEETIEKKIDLEIKRSTVTLNLVTDINVVVLEVLTLEATAEH